MRWLLWALAVLAALPAASAVDEADAPAVWQQQFENDWLVAVGHAPEVPEPGTQWQGMMKLRPGHNVTDAHYQICRVGYACFGPPTPAETEEGLLWAFDTDDYRDAVHGEPVDYKAGWRIGVQWVLVFAGSDEAVLFPEGIPFNDPACEEDYIACSESHYVAFDMGEAEPRATIPAPGLVAVLALAFLVARRR